MSKLYLQTNENGYITGWASMGSIENGVEVDASLLKKLDPALLGCQRYVGGKVVTDNKRITAKENAAAASAEMAEILAWFEWYDNQVCQYQRAVRLGEDFDKNIAELDAEAAEKQARIRELQSTASR